MPIVILQLDQAYFCGMLHFLRQKKLPVDKYMGGVPVYQMSKQPVTFSATFLKYDTLAVFSILLSSARYTGEHLVRT
jgi:hypothetical protein